MTLPPPKFAPHGESQFEVRGQILILKSTGPFNAEHISSLYTVFNQYAAELQPRGPWATVNIVYRSVMATPEAVEMLRRSAEVTHRLLGRAVACYVMGPEVEGRRLMESAVRASCAGIMPLEIFETLEPALDWTQAQLDAIGSG